MLELEDLNLAPKRKLLEKDIESKVVRYAEKKGWRGMKFVSPNYRSVPDRIFFRHPGRVFFIEFKKGGEKPTEKQQREIDRLKAEGFSVFVVDDVQYGYSVIDKMSI